MYPFNYALVITTNYTVAVPAYLNKLHCGRGPLISLTWVQLIVLVECVSYQLHMDSQPIQLCHWQ